MANEQSFHFQDALKQLEQINQWFQQEDIDLEEGLKKLKEGKELITKCQARLQEVENEFIEIQGEMTTSVVPSEE